MSSVHICPVCGGKGTVLAGFYDDTDLTTTASAPQKMCRACRGAGVIIVRDTVYPPGKELSVTIDPPLKFADWETVSVE